MNTFCHGMNSLSMSNHQKDSDSSNTTLPEAATNRPTLELRKSLSPPTILESTAPRIKKSSPPPILKWQPRIPMELQAIFLESSRNGTAHTPPPSKIAIKVYSSPRWCSKIEGETNTADDSTERANKPLQRKSLKVSRPLSFGCNQTATFETSEPSDELYFKPSRWGVKKADRKPELPPKLPGRSC